MSTKEEREAWVMLARTVMPFPMLSSREINELATAVVKLCAEVDELKPRAEAPDVIAMLEAEVANLKQILGFAVKSGLGRDLVAANQRIEQLEGISAMKSEIINRFPFCSDHRDKVRDEPCQRCLVEHQARRIEKLREFLRDRGFHPPAKDIDGIGCEEHHRLYCSYGTALLAEETSMGLREQRDHSIKDIQPFCPSALVESREHKSCELAHNQLRAAIVGLGTLFFATGISPAINKILDDDAKRWSAK